MSQFSLSLHQNCILLNNQPYLPVYTFYGVNIVSVFLMGSCFGDVKGYLADGTLNTQYTMRLTRILDAADALGIFVLDGCLYWGNSQAKWEHWTQNEANIAITSTVRWLADNDYRNTIVDVDNDGMALCQKGFDDRELVKVGKEIGASILIGTNFKGTPPSEADLALHFSNTEPDKPYIESEGSPKMYLAVIGEPTANATSFTAILPLVSILRK